MLLSIFPNLWQVSRKSKTIKKRKPASFKPHWLKEPQLKTWLQSRYNESKKMTTAYCTVCHRYLTNGLGDLVDHSQRPKHLANMDRVEDTAGERGLLQRFTDPPGTRRAVVKAKIIIALTLAERNIPLLFADWLIPAMKRAFYDSQLLEQFKMKRTALSNIIRLGILFLCLSLGSHLWEFSFTLQEWVNF